MVHPVIAEKKKIVSEDMIARQNKKRRVLNEDYFVEGTLVMLENPVRSNKTEPRYLGPFEIGKTGPGNKYRLKDMDGDYLENTVSADKLKYIRRRKNNEDKDNIYTVKEIVDHRIGPEGWEFFIDWAGYGVKDRSWVKDKDLIGGTLVQNYMNKCPEFRVLIEEQNKR